MSVDVAALGRVAVLMGGSSAERAVSLMSGTGVLAALQSLGVDAHAFDPAERDLGELKREGFQRALHGAVFAMAAMQGDEAAAETLALQLDQIALGRVEAMRIDALALQRGEHALAAHQ